MFLLFWAGALLWAHLVPAWGQNADPCCPGGVCPPNLNSPLGTNLSEVVDYTTEIVFVDAFKASREWITQNNSVWDTGEESSLDLDAQGWVRSLPQPGDPAQYTFVGTLMFVGLQGHYPGGQYIVLYDGEGTIEYSWDASKDVAASAPGRDVVNVTPTNNGIYLKITATDPNGTGNYLRNIRFVPAAFESNYDNQVFLPEFLDRVRKYKTIRFMDWMRTNGSPQSQWADRPKVDDVRYTTPAGVPVEIMMDLVNRLSADPWFTLPHMADDDYVTQFATMVHDRLPATQRVYVEYSNEVWNGAFSQGSWIEQQGQAQWPGGSASGYTKRINWYGKRSAEICQIWKNVFAGDADRVVCVMGAQAANTWIGDQALSCPLWDQGPCDVNMDAVAIAPYFGGYLGDPSVESEVEGWTYDADGGLGKLFTELQQGGVLSSGPPGGAIQQAIGWMNDYIPVANSHQVELIFYEGGQHLVGYNGVENNGRLTTLFTTANRDPRMGDAYDQYLQGWRDSGAHLFAHYLNQSEYNKWGSWGAREHRDDNNAPKYITLMNFIDNHACWWTDCACPIANTTPTPTPTATTTPPTPTPTPTVTPTPTATPTPTPPLQALFPHTAATPALDGVAEATWNIAPVYSLDHWTLGSPTSDADISASFQTMHDDTYLYFFFHVTDDALFNDSGNDWWDDDVVELFLDGNHSRGSAYDGIDDFQFGFRWNDPNLQIGDNSAPDPGNITFTILQNVFSTFAVAQNPSGYNVEARIPLAAVHITPTPGYLFGLEVQVDDDDNGGPRENKKAWNATNDNTWQYPFLFGEGKLVTSAQNTPTPTPQSASLGDRVWNDEDVDGIQDPGESGQDGVTVLLYEDDHCFGAAVATTSTTNGGQYTFDHLTPGTYSLRFQLPSGYTFSPAHATTDERDSDANPIDGCTGPITLSSGQNDTSWDAGISQLADLSLTKELNNLTPYVGEIITFTLTVTNQGPGDATGVEVTDQLPSGYTYVSDDGNGAYNSATGVWTIGNLANGASQTLHIQAQVQAPGTYLNWAEVTAADQVDPDSSPDQDHTVDDLKDGQPDDDEASAEPNAVTQANARIGDLVWWDIDRDGIQDPGEPGISNVVLTLSGTSTANTTTDASGIYTFANLLPGNYTVQVDDANFTTGPLKDWQPSPQNVGDDSKDSDGDPTTHQASVPLGVNEVNHTIDFGFTIPTSYTLTKTLNTPEPVRPGQPISFTILITNTGKSWLATLPLQDTYNTDYLIYGYGSQYAQPDSDDHIDDGAIDWSDALGGNPLAPGQSTSITVYFTARADTTQLPDGKTRNVARAHDGTADPDGPSGPLGALEPLPEHSDDAQVAIVKPTGVILTSFHATPRDAGVDLRWRTLNESQIAGFRLLRAVDVRGRLTVPREIAFIPARHSGMAQGQRYQVWDDQVRAGARYRYWLEVVRVDGSTYRLPPRSVWITRLFPYLFRK